MFVGTILFLAIGSLSVESYQYRTEGFIRDTGLVRIGNRAGSSLEISCPSRARAFGNQARTRSSFCRTLQLYMLNFAFEMEKGSPSFLKLSSIELEFFYFVTRLGLSFT
jgi:hypothetical protein